MPNGNTDDTMVLMGETIHPAHATNMLAMAIRFKDFFETHLPDASRDDVLVWLEGLDDAGWEAVAEQANERVPHEATRAQIIKLIRSATEPQRDIWEN